MNIAVGQRQSEILKSPHQTLQPSSVATSKLLSAGSFIDLYAGCGGLSLGLMTAGWRGLFAIERDRHAFETLKHNLIDSAAGSLKYEWPTWLPKKRFRIAPFIKKYRQELTRLKGQVDLLVGGPPCQGFSMAGKRRKDDPRNAMFLHCIELVKLIRPRLLLLENVKGIDIKFDKKNSPGTKRKGTVHSETVSGRIRRELERVNYQVFVGIVDASIFGVPQTRQRYFVVAIDKQYLSTIDAKLLEDGAHFDPFRILTNMRAEFLLNKRLSPTKPVSVRHALSDLETTNQTLIECVDSPGFKQVLYNKPLTRYQKLLHGTMNGTSPNSMRLVNHRKETKARFKLILKTCRRGVLLSPSDRKRLGMKKHATLPLDGNKPSHTLTTLPDDILHYSEARILTVRESARLQSFPDSFEFKGKYTTGGKERVKECPRYTQVGNAVPPLVAEIMGLVLAKIMLEIIRKRAQGSHTRRSSAPKRDLAKAA